MVRLARILVILLLFIVCFTIHTQDLTHDQSLKSGEDSLEDKSKKPKTIDNPEDYDWLRKYISIDPSDDVFFGRIYLKNYRVEEDYVKNLKWRQNINFYLPELDKYNLRQNSNNLPWFPLVIIPCGNLVLRPGGKIFLIDLMELGFLYRHDNIANSRLSFTTAFSFSHLDKLTLLAHAEYPALLKNDRLGIFSTLAFSTSFFQYSGSYLYHSDWFAGHTDNNIILKFTNRVWRALNARFTETNSTGLRTINGINFRIPFFEVNSISALELKYQYNDARIYHNDFFPPDALYLRENAFNVNLIQEFKWNKMKQTTTIQEGNYLSLWTKFILPTGVGTHNHEFRFQSRLEDRFYRKLFREFGFKFRFLMAANYNSSQDFSGEPYVRGLTPEALTGFFAMIGNLELFVPLLHVNIKRGLDIHIKKDAHFILYLVLFFDGGFTIDNLNFLFDSIDERKIKWDYINQNLGYFILDYGFYMTPAFTTGLGLRAHPYFMNFIIRLDVSVNILKAAIRQESPDVQIGISFNDMF